jgi:tetratricopeptide (TPR) repeat protein
LALVGPCAAFQATREVGRWQLALALRHWEAGEKELAQARFEAAERWLGDSPDLLMQRAAWRLEEGDIEGALLESNRAVAAAPGRVRSLIYRSHILQHAGRHAEAIADWQEIVRQMEDEGPQSQAQALNGLAYARAVAQVDLDTALADVNRALELNTSAYAAPAYMDTRGYIHYLQGRYDRALNDLNPAVLGMEQVLAPTNGRSRLVAGPQFHDLSNERGIAVVRFHRALVLLALGREKEAEVDLARVRELIGGEPDESLF